MEVMPDHIHIFVGAKPTVAPIDIVRILKALLPLDYLRNIQS